MNSLVSKINIYILYLYFSLDRCLTNCPNRKKFLKFFLLNLIIIDNNIIIIVSVIGGLICLVMIGVAIFLLIKFQKICKQLPYSGTPLSDSNYRNRSLLQESHSRTNSVGSRPLTPNSITIKVQQQKPEAIELEAIN